MTYTYTRYFSEDDVEPLATELAKLIEDFTSRVPHINREAAEAGWARLKLIETGLHLLVEPVPLPFGG